MKIDERLLVILQKYTTPGAEISADSDLDMLGIESLDRFEIAIELEEEFNITLRDEDVADVETVQGLMEMLQKALGK